MTALEPDKKNFMSWLKAACEYHDLKIGIVDNDYNSLWCRVELEAMRPIPRGVFIASSICQALTAGGPIAIYGWVNEHRTYLETGRWRTAIDRRGFLADRRQDEQTISDERRHDVPFRYFELLTTRHRRDVEAERKRAIREARKQKEAWRRAQYGWEFEYQRRAREKRIDTQVRKLMNQEHETLEQAQRVLKLDFELKQNKLRGKTRPPYRKKNQAKKKTTKQLDQSHLTREQRWRRNSLIAFVRAALHKSRPLDMGGQRSRWMTWTPEQQAREF